MPHRAGELTYYEELGVAQDASPEQVRDCFRALVRLLHPDQQTDLQLKDVAERQMRKLNRIYSVLSDPEKRRRYDDTLEEDGRGPTIIFSPTSNVNVGRIMARLVWVGAIVIAVVILTWLASDGPSPQPVQAPERGNARVVAAAGTTAGDSPEEVERLRADLRIARFERDAAIHELTRLRGQPPVVPKHEQPAAAAPQIRPQPSVSTTITELPAPSRAVAAPPPPLLPRDPAGRPPSVPAKRFGGFWFYARPPQGQHNKNAALYPPEFIEATITEQNGVLRGRYRARYQIVDRAIPPDVNFEFTGSGSGPVIVCPWTGPGGSRGEITLKVTGENSMQVDWTATELGSAQGLVLGTANLTRRID